MAEDDRVAYGATCSWWGLISEVATMGDTRGGLPCCPHCRGVLMEVESQAVWWAGVDRHEASGEWPGYRAFIEWLHGRCFRTGNGGFLILAKSEWLRSLEQDVATNLLTCWAMHNPGNGIVYLDQARHEPGGRWSYTNRIETGGRIYDVVVKEVPRA